jgi:SAM-dependent methyltransferase
VTAPANYSFTHYLAAKKTVDDRALNQHVWQSLVNSLFPLTPDEPLRVIEVGAGIGTMIERLLERDVLGRAAYTAIDAEPQNVLEARRRLPLWAGQNGYCLTEGRGEQLCLQHGKREVCIELETIDVFDFISRERGRRTWDLLIAHAFLDMVHVPRILPLLCSMLRDGGLLYLTIAFDGMTTLQPVIDPDFDALVETLYHRTADERTVDEQPSGDSWTGRHLFEHLRGVGAELLDAGSSDWVVFAGPDGYVADEKYFLHFIIHNIHTALEGHPHLDAGRFTDWIARRHAQVEEGVLVYIAHQLDFLARVSKHH